MPRLKSHPIGAASCLTSSMNALLNIGTQRAFRFFSSCVIKLEIEILRIITHCTCAGSRTLRRCFGQCYHPLHPFGKLADWLRLIMSKNCGVYLSAPALLIIASVWVSSGSTRLAPDMHRLHRTLRNVARAAGFHTLISMNGRFYRMNGKIC